jgi:hypothetical protein
MIEPGAAESEYLLRTHQSKKRFENSFIRAPWEPLDHCFQSTLGKIFHNGLRPGLRSSELNVTLWYAARKRTGKRDLSGRASEFVTLGWP